MPSSVAATTTTQWRMTASITTLKSVWYRGSTYVTLQYPLKGRPKYPPALATMVSRSKYVQRSQIVLGPTPYAAKISRHLSLYRASYELWRSNNTLNRSASLMAMICCRSLALRVAVPAPWTARNLCSASWNLMDDASWRFRRLVKDFQSNSTRPNPLKSLLAPLGIRTTVCHVLSSDSVPSRNCACTTETTLC